MNSRVVNLDDQAQKSLLLDFIRKLGGRHRVEIVKYRPRRSDRQNRYYWPCFAEPFADWMSERYGESVNAEQAHEMLKLKFARKSVVNVQTGEVESIPCGTSTMTTEEFNEYLDKLAAWLKDFCGIEVPTPDVYRET